MFKYKLNEFRCFRILIILSVIIIYGDFIIQETIAPQTMDTKSIWTLLNYIQVY